MLKKIKLTISLALGAAVFTGAAAVASMQEMRTMNAGNGAPTMIGKMSIEEYNRINAEGAAAVAAITPTSAPLSKTDEKLLMEVAMGGMMQLEISRAAVGKVTGEEAKILAQSEVEEQTALGSKLKEIAAAKNIMLPASPDSKTQAMIGKMQNQSGAGFDKIYVSQSGVKNHEKLDKVMSKVESKATDPALRAVAQAAHPLVRTHLQVSKDVLAKMSGGMSENSNSNRTNNNSSNNNNSNSNSNSNNSNSNNSNRGNSNNSNSNNSNSNNNSNRGNGNNSNSNSNR